MKVKSPAHLTGGGDCWCFPEVIVLGDDIPNVVSHNGLAQVAGIMAAQEDLFDAHSPEYWMEKARERALVYLDANLTPPSKD